MKGPKHKQDRKYMVSLDEGFVQWRQALPGCLCMQKSRRLKCGTLFTTEEGPTKVNTVPTLDFRDLLEPCCYCLICWVA